jgi:Transcriptional regulators
VVWQAERQAGYEAAAREYGIELLPLPEVLPITNEVNSSEHFQRYSRIVSTVLSRYVGGAEPIEAIVAESDVAVPFFQRALRELGITPGRNLPVFGYDNYYFLSGPFQWESTPPAATIDKNDLLIGEKAVELIMRRVQAGEELSDSFREAVPPRLVIPEQP